MGARTRLDAELLRRGLAASRTAAQQLIGAGRVTVDGAPALKPATLVTRGQSLRVADDARQWASRGGYKLDGALGTLGVDPAGLDCLDAGASTGGFTDVLLDRGARRVVAVDVGYGQLRWRLRTDPRVVVLDRTNVRYLEPGAVAPPPPSLVVADLSFISLRLVLPALCRVAADDAALVVMVKPQFEVGPERVGAGGVVTAPAAWRSAVEGVVETAWGLGRGLAGATVSGLPGPSGNVEFFVHLRPGPATVDSEATLTQLVAAGAVIGGDRPRRQ